MRTQPVHPLAKLMLPAVIAAAVILAVLPGPYLRWTTGVARLLRAAVTPISHPMVIIARWLAPAASSRETERVRELEAEARTFELRWRQSDQRIDELLSLIADLQSGRELAAPVGVEVAAYPVVGYASDVASGALLIRAGTRQGVTVQSSVAATAGTQLVGRVVFADRGSSVVLPITDRAAGANIRAAVIVNDGDPAGLAIDCLLLPSDQPGRLAGPATVLDPTPAMPEPPTPRPGMTVRLRDPEWPRSAQQLVIGDIEEVRPSDDDPLRPWIVVAPRVELRGVGEVLLYTPASDAGSLDDTDGEAAP